MKKQINLPPLINWWFFFEYRRIGTHLNIAWTVIVREIITQRFALLFYKEIYICPKIVWCCFGPKILCVGRLHCMCPSACGLKLHCTILAKNYMYPRFAFHCFGLKIACAQDLHCMCPKIIFFGLKIAIARDLHCMCPKIILHYFDLITTCARDLHCICPKFVLFWPKNCMCPTIVCPRKLYYIILAWKLYVPKISFLHWLEKNLNYAQKWHFLHWPENCMKIIYP